MRGYKKTSLLLLITSSVMVGTVIATFSVPAQNNSAPGKQQKFDRTEFENQFPVTDTTKPESSDPEKRARRRAKGKKYDYAGIPITESSDTLTVSSEWDVGLQALPVSKSDLVVIGVVTDAQAYLTNDKTGVYSEFTIRVDEVLKNAGNFTLTQGSTLVADRQGGRVRFPSGHTTIQFVRGQGMLRVGRRYTLFLTHNGQEENAHILTGYELVGGRVFPIDNPAGGQHPIATVYKEADELSFLSDLRAAIASAQ
jgi:hypothetical protein